MNRVQLELDDELLAQAEQLASKRGISVEQLLSMLLDQAGSPGNESDDRVLGLFKDEPDLMDRVVEDSLQSREVTPLRIPNG